MAGYGARTHPSEGVRQPLFVKALALEDQTGAKSVMVTSDLLGFPRVVAEPNNVFIMSWTSSGSLWLARMPGGRAGL